MLNITGTRTFRGNWYLGFRWRLVGGSPFTPYDENVSSIKAAWDVKSAGYQDYTRYNDLRLKSFHQLDIRVDKQYYFKKWSVNFYLDIQNIYNFKADAPPNLVRSSFVDPTVNDVYTDTNGIQRYRLETISSAESGTILPTIGIIVEF